MVQLTLWGQKSDDRRYVIDEIASCVDIFCAYNSLGNVPDSQEIRVVGGKVNYVFTVTMSGRRGCRVGVRCDT